jgi:hypothetical protein
MATYITITRGAQRLATVDFDDDEPCAGRFVVRDAAGNATGLVTCTGTGFRVEAPGVREYAGTWYGVARVLFAGPVELTA